MPKRYISSRQLGGGYISSRQLGGGIGGKREFSAAVADYRGDLCVTCPDTGRRFTPEGIDAYPTGTIVRVVVNGSDSWVARN